MTMSENKHTPGPWRVGPYAMHVFADNAKIGGDAMVCEIRGWGYLTGNGHGALGLSAEQAQAIQTANTNLIASAPDLLEALKRAVAILDGELGSWGDRNQADWMAIDAALSKAQGTQS